MKIRSNEQFSDISSIKLQTGAITTDPTQTDDTFCSFYSDLHKSDISFDKDKCDKFLSQLNMPHLFEADESNLARPISLEELKAAVLSMQRGKLPGLNGIPPVLYLVFWTLLGPLLLSMIRLSIEKGSFSWDVNIAVISLRFFTILQ